MGGKVAKPQSDNGAGGEEMGLAAGEGRSTASEQGEGPFAGEQEALRLRERGASVGEKESPGEKHGRAGGSRGRWARIFGAACFVANPPDTECSSLTRQGWDQVGLIATGQPWQRA